MRPLVEGDAVSNDLSDLGRFSDPSLLILASLAGGPKHGYAMIEDIAAMAGVHLGPGTLYGAIARLEQRGLIAPLPADDRRRLEAEIDDMTGLVSTGLRRLKRA